MDSEIKPYRSLPPLVEGKIQGYLKLIVDEVVWSRKSPGDITVVAVWWGELDSAQFRPVDINTGTQRAGDDIVETYAIRTNTKLFGEYLKNCETIEFVVIIEKTHQFIGSAHISDLIEISKVKAISRYVPIISEGGNRLGDIHVGIKLLINTNRISMMPVKENDFHKYEEDIKKSVLHHEDLDLKLDSNCKNDYSRNLFNYRKNTPLAVKNAKHNENVCKSILKEKRADWEQSPKKPNSGVTDKLVAQVLARAQRLRGVLLKEACDEDLLAANERSMLGISESDSSIENEAKLYEYFLGKKMSHWAEHKALETLKSTSPTPSLLNLATETIKSCQFNNNEADTKDYSSHNKMNEIEKTISSGSIITKSNDSIRFIIESLSLTSAGFRRVRSSCLSRGDGVPVSVTYFVQYETVFANIKKNNRNLEKENRPAHMCSKRQIGQVIYFNHEAVYSISKACLHSDTPIKFKVFNRHLNQRTPTELGIGFMRISDIAQTDFLSMTQKVAIVNKGIKIGELKVLTELGCDCIHFGRQFVEAVMCAKENIPILEISSSMNLGSNRYKSATGTESKTNSRVSSASMKQRGHVNNEADNSASNRDVPQRNKQNSEDQIVGIKKPEHTSNDKILLHGLIFIAEGRDLPQQNTYLICRALWREDRATSRLCNGSNNPLYNFHQLIPLIHGPDLLERTKDNCIITEIYSKNSLGTDSLIGIAKLPVHQLYVAYRDPQVVPHLLQLKYPIISVDGWVPIVNPVTGQPSGQLLALVALGTADQIALLEMIRGLRDCAVTPRTLRNHPNGALEQERYRQAVQDPSTNPIIEDQNSASCCPIIDNNVLASRGSESPRRSTNIQIMKTQESQTDVTTIEGAKATDNVLAQARTEILNSQSSVLHELVDRLAQVLSAPKANSIQTVETQTSTPEELKASTSAKRLCLDLSCNNSLSDNSSNGSPREPFRIPTEMYRSVGVGAEFDEEANLLPSTSYGIEHSDLSPRLQPLVDDDRDTERELSHSEEPFFRAAVEIECALHLPKVERLDDAIEPSTYVTFQKFRNSTNVEQFGSYVITNVYPSNCNPKWEWRCDTRLPTELLVNDEKRMILKVWRLLDAEVNSKVDLEHDIVIGFSALDLSVLTAGFPIVSGWFHIMDFTGKCNGQIKVTVTPLEDISSFGKTISSKSLSKAPAPGPTELNWCSAYPQNTLNSGATFNNAINPACCAESRVPNSHNRLDNDPAVELGFGDVSMSFLSLSLQQKLSELHEITKRLQSRLHDVTNAAFDDDFDNDFDTNDPDMDNDYRNNAENPATANTVFCDIANWSMSNNRPPDHGIVNGSRKSHIYEDNVKQLSHLTGSNNGISPEPNFTDTGYSTSSNVPSNRPLSNGQHNTITKNGNHLINDDSSNVNNGYPARGTRTHIGHLLDKLSLQLSAAPPPATCSFPMKRNVIDLVNSLQYRNNSARYTDRRYRQNARTVLTQTDNVDQNSRANLVDSRNSESRSNYGSNNDFDMSVNGASVRRERISTLIREELVAEENNDTPDCDELSTHLVTSNVRHMGTGGIFHPLIYQHLIPDVHANVGSSVTCNAAQSEHNLDSTPESEAVMQLDNAYVENFNATINNGLSRIRNLIDIDTLPSSEGGGPLGSRDLMDISEGHIEAFRLTPSGVSENVDRNIDVTLVRKPSNDDLMASNSAESTSTISPDKSSARRTVDVDDDRSLTSSESSVSGVSRQAPDGGNPAEETGKVQLKTRVQDSQDSTTDS
ncbi:uncharacterized protein LOC105704343 isoform X2 [Orussus abietinus]|uniref:uncharacterized protein LOC105704343 isoform X2 n=1 Tax=Orussus abietinus TaxID=222816 RepID=UPI0006264AE5|nr:uncharacterized protein LOC105704343 isoform X2 [Orussus abietinus]